MEISIYSQREKSDVWKMEWESKTLNTVCSLGYWRLAGPWRLPINVGLYLCGHQIKWQCTMYWRTSRPNFTSECRLCASLTVHSSRWEPGTWLSEYSQWTVSWQERFVDYRQHDLWWVFALDLGRWQEGVPGWPDPVKPLNSVCHEFSQETTLTKEKTFVSPAGFHWERGLGL